MCESEITSTFDYGHSKAAYFELVALNTNCERLDRQKYSCILNELQLSSQDSGATVSGADAKRFSYIHEYEIFEDNGARFLIKRRKYPDDPVLKFIPVEDSFDFLNTIHLTVGHGKPQKFREVALKTYAVDESYVDYILEACNVCSELSNIGNSNYIIVSEPGEDETKNVKQFNNDVWVEIIDMGHQYGSDGRFMFLLLYVNVETSFTLLRPLILKCALEVATEILNIFAGFGPPLRLQTYECEESFFREVLLNVQKFCPDSEMPHIETFENKTISVDVLSTFDTWMFETRQRNWGIACHLFQWYLNNKTTDIHGSQSSSMRKTDEPTQETPIHSVFKNSESESLESEEIDPIYETGKKKVKEKANSNKPDTYLDTHDWDNDWYTAARIKYDISLPANEEGFCYVCERQILSAYTCSVCQSSVHVFCCSSPKYLSTGELQYTCLNCDNI